MAKKDWTSQLIVWVIGGSLVIGLLAVISIWYIVIGLLATVLVVVAWFSRKAQQEIRDELLRFDRGDLLPGPVAETESSAPFSEGPTRVEVDLVELERYHSNWDHFRKVAQVARAGTVRVHGLVVCFLSPQGNRGILVAHGGRVLGEVRQVDLPIYFDALWQQGGKVRAGCHFKFDANLAVQRAFFEIQVYNGYTKDQAPGTGVFSMWVAAWDALRGK
jgi:hypothetical protein